MAELHPPLPEEPPAPAGAIHESPVPEPTPIPDPAPEPEPIPEPEPQPADVPQEDLWKQICEALNGRIQVASYRLLFDPLQVSPVWEGDTLRIRLDKFFAAKQFNNPGVSERIREAATQCAGRPIRVVMEEMDTREQINQRSIDELARFGNVTIK